MTDREDVVRWAREAGLGTALTHNGSEPTVYIEGANWHEELTRFAKLVAEQCAKLCLEEVPTLDGQLCAEAIRERMK